MMEEEQPVRVRTPRKGEMYGVVESLAGASRLIVRCEDGNERVVRIPGKIRRRVWVRAGDLVIVKPWEMESNRKADLVWRYIRLQVDWLKSKGLLKGKKF